MSVSFSGGLLLLLSPLCGVRLMLAVVLEVAVVAVVVVVNVVVVVVDAAVVVVEAVMVVVKAAVVEAATLMMDGTVRHIPTSHAYRQCNLIEDK